MDEACSQCSLWELGIQRGKTFAGKDVFCRVKIGRWRPTVDIVVAGLPSVSLWRAKVGNICGIKKQSRRNMDSFTCEYSGSFEKSDSNDFVFTVNVDQFIKPPF